MMAKSVFFTLVVILALVTISESKKGDKCPNTNPKKNEAIVRNAYQQVFTEQQFDKMVDYYHPEFIQHNPHINDGMEGLKEYVLENKGFPEWEHSEILRSAAQDDLVFLHVRMKGKNPGTPTLAIMDVFRIECGLIKEHWDAIQEVKTEGAVNDHPYF